MASLSDDVRFVLRAIGRLVRAKAMSMEKPPDVAPPVYEDIFSGFSTPAKKRIVWASTAIIIFLFLLVTVLRDLGYYYGFRISEKILDSASAWMAFWIALGWSAASKRQVIANRFDRLFDAFVGEEHKSPWALQAIVALFVLLGVLVAMRPDLMDKVESIKAGDFEAKFASSAANVRNAKLTISDFDRDSNIVGYKGFVFFNDLQNCEEIQDDNSYVTKARLVFYKLNEENFIKMKITCILFSYIRPLLTNLDCLRMENNFEKYRRNNNLRDLGLRFANLSEIKLSNPPRISPIANVSLEYLEYKAQYKRAFKSSIELVVDTEIEMRKDALQNLFVLPSSSNPKIAEAACNLVKYPNEGDEIYKKNSVEKAERLWGLIETLLEKDPKLDIWDAYIITAISDMLDFTMGPREKANFLHRNRKRFEMPVEAGKVPMPGQINFLGQIINSKNRTNELWSLAKSADEVRQHLDGVNAILNSIKLKEFAQKFGQWSEIQAIYNRNRFVGLTNGLQMFALHALAGETITGSNLALWREILDETIPKLRTFQSPSRLWRFLKDGDQWQGAIDKIEEEPGVIADAARFTSLSAILIPEQTGRASKLDCAAAKSLLAIATSETWIDKIKTAYVQYGDDIARLKAYNEQISRRIDLSCGR